MELTIVRSALLVPAGAELPAAQTATTGQVVAAQDTDLRVGDETWGYL